MVNTPQKPIYTRTQIELYFYRAGGRDDTQDFKTPAERAETGKPASAASRGYEKPLCLFG